MGGALKGIGLSLIFLIIAGMAYYAILYYGVTLTFVAILCADIPHNPTDAPNTHLLLSLFCAHYR
jgi:hypothetical protein